MAISFFVSYLEGRARVCVDQGEDEPPFMRSVGRVDLSTMEGKATAAAVRAAPSCQRDAKAFLYWDTIQEAKTAAKAATRALRGQ